MYSSLRRRLRHEQGGFTLIELLVVIIIIGILLAIAVPSYLGFRGRANVAAAKSNVRAAIPNAEAYFADNGSYTGMTAANLKSTYDSGISLSNVVIPTATTYCLESDSNGSAAGGTDAHKTTGPGGTIVSGNC